MFLRMLAASIVLLVLLAGSYKLRRALGVWLLTYYAGYSGEGPVRQGFWVEEKWFSAE